MTDKEKSPEKKPKEPPFKDHEWGTDDPAVIEVRKGLPPKKKPKD